MATEKKQAASKEEPLEKQLWKAADKLRKNIDAAEYKHVVLGLIFLKYISDSFEEMFTKLQAGEGDYAGADPEDKDEYTAESVFFVPPEARWPYLVSKATQADIGSHIDDAMDAIERENPSLKGVLPKVFARQNLDPIALGDLVTKVIGGIAFGDTKARSADVLGHVFEYFLGEFALAEGKQGGQFYTPKSIVELLVAMLEPYKGRVYDPCCGSGGMFVQSEKFVTEHQGRINDISIYGQESNQTTWRLAQMNLAIRGINSAQVKWNNEGSFLNDAHKDLKADFIIANHRLPTEVVDLAVKEVLRTGSPELLAANEAFHRWLTEGVPVSRQKDGDERGERVWLIDFDQPERNDFLVVNQFTVAENQQKKRLDMVLFVNGLPLVVVELKNATDENATIKTAYQQIETYKQTIPSMFVANAWVVISDGLEAKAGSISAGLSRFMAWKSADGKAEASHLVSQLETLIVGMLNPATLVDMLRHFIVFEKARKEDPETGQITISTVKKLAAYHQYYAVNAAVVSTLRAADLGSGHAVRENPASYGVPGVSSQPKGDKKAGVVWHTQGSGKSLSMVFYTGKIVQAMDNPTVLVITDRNDLDDQLFDTFAASRQLLRQDPVQAENRAHLESLLKVAAGGVVFSTIQKFQPEQGNVYEQLSPRHNIVVIADEAHRTQYGFAAKTADDKNAAGEVVGKKVVYGFAKYLRDALPFATYLGFTGTPIEKTDANTPAVFGNYVDIYDIAQAVADGATVRIFYESRLAKVSLSDEGKQLVADLDDELEQDELTETQKAKAKWTKMEALIGSEPRVRNIAQDIVAHFEARQEVFAGKGMIVSMSRRIAADLYAEIIKLRPDWHDSDLKKGVIKVVMTASSSDGPALSQHHTTKEQRKLLAERMKDDTDPLKLVIVRDMWLTGFDAPCMHTLYIDKPMKGHNLMQAIARVNRVYKDKPGGLVVDYLGIASDLKMALSFYSDAGGRGDPTLAQEQAVKLMLEKLEVVSALFYGFAYEQYFDADTAQKLSLILAAEEHILGLDDGRKRYIEEVTALSQAFAIAVPHDQALDAKDEVGFFQAVKARLVKFDGPSGGRSNEELETTIRQVIDQVLVSERVIDVFDAAGIKKPDISVLSDDFLAELKGYEHKNVALEVLKKLLNDELKVRAKRNLIQARSLMEMLEAAIRKYHAKVLTAAEVMDELIKVSKEIVASDNEAKSLGLTDFEYAFYTAVANNDSARELMQKDQLRELAVVLTQRVRENTSIDWTIKENVKAKLKVIVKRTLRHFGYPPDMQLLATETVLKQAEIMAAELSTD